MEDELLDAAAADPLRRVGGEYLLVRPRPPEFPRDAVAMKYFPWRLPVSHSWPCVPWQTDGFIEKAAGALAKRFAAEQPRTVLVGSLDGGPAASSTRKLASNLRGRALQILPGAQAVRDVETLDPTAPVLYAMVGKSGLFAGMASPRETNGFHPGGEKFTRAGSISRAGGKIAGALHHLRLHRPPPAAGAHWLELGASPGGITAELLDRGYRVTAVDRAPLDPSLRGKPGLAEVHADVRHFRPAAGTRFDAILCDMNGDPRDAMRGVLRQTGRLAGDGLVIFTLKLAGAEGMRSIDRLAAEVLALAHAGGLALFGITHLPANRHEFTCFLAPQKAGPAA